MKTLYLAALILVVLLSACIQERPEPLSDPMKHQLALLPQDVDVLGYVNLQKIQQSQVSKLITDSADCYLFHEQELAELKSATGFDFPQDVGEVYFALTLNEKVKGLNGLFVATGSYDPAKIVAYINLKSEDKKIIEETYNQFKIYRPAEEPTVFCFADQHTLVGGKETTVKAWLDKFNRSTGATLAPDWQQAVESLKYKNGLWLVMTTKNLIELLEQETGLPKNLRGIKNIKNGSCSMDFSDRISFYGQGECMDPETAILFRDAFRGFLASAKLAVSDKRDLVDIINKISADTKKETVMVQFILKAEELEKLLRLKKTHTHSGSI
jgi:hypothetical protein